MSSYSPFSAVLSQPRLSITSTSVLKNMAAKVNLMIQRRFLFCFSEVVRVDSIHDDLADIVIKHFLLTPM